MPEWNTLTSFPNSNGIFSASMTTLANGKILVSGGEALVNPFPTEIMETNCYLYDPVAATWSVTGALNVTRVNSHTVTLNTGKILTIGGRVSDIDAAGLASCELYDVNTGLWSNTGSLNESRYGYGVWILNSGDILVAGGNGGGGIGNTQRDSTELYSVSGGTWTNTGHNLPETLEWPYFFSLSDGTPIAAGGNNTAGTISVYKYNTSTGWAVETTYPLTGYNDTTEDAWNRSILMGDGRILICATNYSLTQKFAPSTTCFIYDPVAHTITQSGSLNTARTLSFQIPTHSGAYVSSGLNPAATADVHSSEIYNIISNTWSVSSDNPPAFYSSATFCKSGSIWYQLGGQVNNGVTVPAFYSFREDIPPMSTFNDTSAISGMQNFHQKGTAGLVIEQGASEPASPVTGQLFYNTTTHLLERYNGSAWISEVSSIHADSNANITGDVQLISGTNIGLSQTGNAITVVATFPPVGPFQVVQATSTTRESTTSTSFVGSSFLTLSITPSVNTHRVKLTFSSIVGADNNGVIVTLFRNAVNLGDATFGFGGAQATASPENSQVACVFVDSPATTSAVTYTVNFRSVSGGTVRLGQFGGVSEATGVLTAEEIPA